MTSFCEIALPDAVSDDAEELFLHPLVEGSKTPAIEAFNSLRGWFEWFVDQSTLSSLPRRKADKVDGTFSQSNLCCHFRGLFAVARGNLVVIGRKENIGQPNFNAIILNQNHFQGVVRDLCWTNDMQCTLLISTKVGVFLNTFPEEHASFVSDYHHIIDTQFIAYLPEINFVYKLSPSPHGRFIVCIGRGKDGSSDHLLHLDTSFNIWHYINLQKPYSGSLIYYPYHIYQYQQTKDSLVKNISSIGWSSNGSTVILLCRGEVITIETYRWLRQSTVAYANLNNFLSFTRLNDTALLSFVSNSSDRSHEIEVNAFLVEPLTYADGSSISSIRSARSSKLDMQQPLTVNGAAVSTNGKFICLSYVINTAVAGDEEHLVDFPCLDIFTAVMDNDNVTLNMYYACTAYRFGTNVKQMVVTHPEKWQTPKSFSFCEQKGGEAMQLLVLWSDMAVTYHNVPLK